MPRLALTVRGLDSLSVPAVGRVDYFDALAPGLVLRVSATARTWSVVYRNAAGRKKRLTLGTSPELALADAREKARAAIRTVGETGADPAAEAVAEKIAAVQAEAAAGLTLGAVFAVYEADYKLTHREWAEKSRIYTVDCLDRVVAEKKVGWRDRPITAITREDVRDLVAAKAKTAPRAAELLAKHLCALFNFAIDKSYYRAANPAARVVRKTSGKKAGGRRARPVAHHVPLDQYPAFEWDAAMAEVGPNTRALWTALHEPAPGIKDAAGVLRRRLAPVHNDLFLFLLVLGQRLGESARVRRRDLDASLRWWTIPETETKNGERHRVPLGATARTILGRRLATVEDRPAAFVFSTDGGRSSIFARAKKAAALLSSPGRYGRAPGLDRPFTAHDLRATAASGMAAAGVEQFHISKVFDHVSATDDTVTAIYNQYAYDREKTAALAAWERALLLLVGETEIADGAATVLPFVS